MGKAAGLGAEAAGYGDIVHAGSLFLAECQLPPFPSPTAGTV